VTQGPIELDELRRFLGGRPASGPDSVIPTFDLIYAELRRLAGAAAGHVSAGRVLQPTALVHEVWLKLTGRVDHLEDPAHFFALAARAMRQIVADHARSARRLKRGGDGARITFSEEMFEAAPDAMDLGDLDTCLERLEAEHERAARVVELRAFGGLSVESVAQLMDISVPTVKRDWQLAKLWIAREFERGVS